MFVRTALFTVKVASDERALPLLREQTSFLSGFAGCRRAFLGAPIHGTAYLIHSEWDDEAAIERLESALRTDPRASASFFGLMPLLTAPPTLSRYEVTG